MRENTRVLLLLGLVAALLAVMGVVSWALIGDDAPQPPPPAVEASFQEVTENQLDAAQRAVGAAGLLDPAVQRFRLRMGRYPHDIDELIDPPADSDESQRWNGPYVFNRELLVDPWGKPYRIESPGVNNTGSYDLWTVGPDGVDGTSDDLGNW